MTLSVVCVVEGQGDAQAIPLLLRRLVAEMGENLKSPKPLRVPKSRLLKDQLERTIELASRKVGRDGGILVVLDADDDCPAQLGPEVLSRARSARADMAIGVVVAKREFEAWLIASAESVAGKRGLQQDLHPPPDPESITGAKEWLSQRMARPYRETIDQAALTNDIDIDRVRTRSGSFDKLCREVEQLATSIRQRQEMGRADLNS